MKRVSKKPFYLKNKLLYQTKINLWNQKLNLKNLKKKKWFFFKKRQKFSSLDSFRFIPFSFGNFKRKRRRQNFKNNLYLRKTVRFKYARLKNYDLYRLFKKSSGYKDFIQSYGSRIDIVLYQLLFPISVFQLRQHLLHGKFFLNGCVIKSPNISLQALDVVSFDLSELANLNTLYEGKRGRAHYFLNTADYFFFHSNYINLKNKDEKERFIINMTRLVTTREKYENILLNFFFKVFKANEKFPEWVGIAQKFSSFKERGFKNKKLNWQEFGDYIKRKIVCSEVSYNLKKKKKRFMLSNVKTSSTKKSLGFFSNEFISNHFEISIRNNYIDCVFLGFSEEKAFIDNNEKYLLHYLFR